MGACCRKQVLFTNEVQTKNEFEVRATKVLTVENLSSELKPVRIKWFELGINLGLKKHELDVIRMDYAPQGCDRQLLEMLAHWLQRAPDAAWMDVVNALQKIEENTLAESIFLKYIGGRSKL